MNGVSRETVIVRSLSFLRHWVQSVKFLSLSWSFRKSRALIVVVGFVMRKGRDEGRVFTIVVFQYIGQASSMLLPTLVESKPNVVGLLIHTFSLLTVLAQLFELFDDFCGYLVPQQRARVDLCCTTL